MHQPYTTNTLTHFVGRADPLDHEGNYGKLSLLLSSSRVSHWPHTDEGERTGYTIDLSKSLHIGQLIVPTVTCFADIPEESLGIHVQKYGCFGLGFKREFLIRAGARPVTYVPMFSNEWLYAINGRYLLEDIAAIHLGFRNHFKARIAGDGKPVMRTMKKVPETEDEILRALKSLLEKEFLAYLKPFNSELPSDHPENFYREREWRKFAYLRFKPTDVERIWVAAGYAGRIVVNFPALASAVTEL